MTLWFIPLAERGACGVAKSSHHLSQNGREKTGNRGSTILSRASHVCSCGSSDNDGPFLLLLQGNEMNKTASLVEIQTGVLGVYGLRTLQ